MKQIRQYLAEKLHEDRDHSRDGCALGDEPICNCYALADKAIAALGGVKVEMLYDLHPSERLSFVVLTDTPTN